ncbi:hypothetical protein [Flavobacterium fluviatile]|uniref:hypothetical protein n=1 Tax=Flavobacterium fluviatile TaxID=1862387 RepID=UPI0013D7696F|nr:hypothetical protein [Flavobacterium fluviatile]
MAKLIKNSKGSQGVKRTTVNYNSATHDLAGHLKGIDDALGLGQENFTRNIYINIDDLNLSEGEEISAEKINIYLATLPAAQKTIQKTDRKTNLVFYSIVETS